MPEGLERLNLVVFDDRYDRVHYALSMAVAAAAGNRPATLFVAGPAVRALTAEGWRSLAGEPEAADRARRARGVADWQTLAEAVVSLNIPVLVCEQALATAGLTVEALTALPVTVTGLVGFYRQADGQIVFI